MSLVHSQTALGPLNPVEQKFAPAGLWLQGDTTLLQQAPKVAVIGTRNPSNLGIARTRKLVKALVEKGVTVVSGLAAGVDTIAHTEAIRLGGRTIAVIGTPIDQVYPRENAELQCLIGEEHLVVSEFKPHSKVSRGNFPRRNRTMALIANASVIIEAGKTSGTISQGWEALRLGRPLFLLRSLIDSGLAWPAQLLEYGAHPLDKAEDLFEVLPSRGSLDAIPF